MAVTVVVVRTTTTRTGAALAVGGGGIVAFTGTVLNMLAKMKIPASHRASLERHCHVQIAASLALRRFLLLFLFLLILLVMSLFLLLLLLLFLLLFSPTVNPFVLFFFYCVSSSFCSSCSLSSCSC